MTPSERWLTALEARHFSDLTFQEVSRSLRALSATYVERRDRLREGAALTGAGKRAAFALFYGPLHYLLVREIIRSMSPGDPKRIALRHERGPATLIDLGCGTGAAGAAWAEACDPHPQVIGVDRHPWTLTEAAQTYRDFGLRARTVRGDAASFAFPKTRAMILAAFTVNELDDRGRASLLPRLMDRAASGDSILIVEPIARSVGRWWTDWQRAFVAVSGRADEWRFRVELPALVAKLDRAAGLDHRELTGRSLYIGQA
jgi:SAM-dependent methyltransferase